MTREQFNNLKPGEIVDDFFNGRYKILSVNKMSGFETDIDAIELVFDESKNCFVETENTINWLESDDIVQYITK